MSPFSWARWLRSLFHSKVKTYRKPPKRLNLEHLETRLAPATFTWSGAGGNRSWTTGANWVGGVAPTGSTSVLDELVFPNGVSQTSTVNDIPVANGVPATFNSITISGSGYTLAGNQIALGSSTSAGSGSLIVTSGSVNEFLTFDIKLNGAANSQQFFTVTLGGRGTISGHLSGTTG